MLGAGVLRCLVVGRLQRDREVGGVAVAGDEGGGAGVVVAGDRGDVGAGAQLRSSASTRRSGRRRGDRRVLDDARSPPVTRQPGVLEPVRRP